MSDKKKTDNVIITTIEEYCPTSGGESIPSATSEEKKPPKKKKKKHSIKRGDAKKKIIAFLESRISDNISFSPFEIARITKIPKPTVNVLCRRLLKDGKIRQSARGLYIASGKFMPVSLDGSDDFIDNTSEEIDNQNREIVENVERFEQLRKEITTAPFHIHGIVVIMKNNKLIPANLNKTLMRVEIDDNVILSSKAKTGENNNGTPSVPPPPKNGVEYVLLSEALDCTNNQGIFKRWSRMRKPQHIKQAGRYQWIYPYKDGGRFIMQIYPSTGTMQFSLAPNKEEDRGIPITDFSDFINWVDNLFMFNTGYSFQAFRECWYVAQIGINVDIGEGKLKKAEASGRTFNMTFDNFEDWIMRIYGHTDEDGQLHGRIEQHLKNGALANTPLETFIRSVGDNQSLGITQQLAILTNENTKRSLDVQEKQANAMNYEMAMLRKLEREHNDLVEKNKKSDDAVGKLTEMLELQMQNNNRLMREIEGLKRKLEKSNEEK